MEDDRWSIVQIEDVEGSFEPLVGDGPDAAIDAAMQSASKPEGDG